MRLRPSGAGLALGVAINPAPSAAQDYAPVVAGATAGALGVRASESEQPVVPMPLPGRELEDWEDPRTGSTAQPFDECATLVELRLTTVGPWNYL